MSAPDTNIEKQEAHHRPSLFGVKGAMLFAVVILFGVVGVYFVMGAADDATNAPSPEVTTVPSDVYEPGTNSSSTPTATD